MKSLFENITQLKKTITEQILKSYLIQNPENIFKLSDLDDGISKLKEFFDEYNSYFPYIMQKTEPDNYIVEYTNWNWINDISNSADGGKKWILVPNIYILIDNFIKSFSQCRNSTKALEKVRGTFSVTARKA
jgi:hypothetical protein